MTPADLIRDNACTAACIAAITAPSRCKCPCGGIHHGALRDVDITALLDARRLGYHRLSDAEIVGAV